MTNSFIQPSFAAGEVSPRMMGRVDYDRYHAALSVGRNFLVDVRGGISTRPGTEFSGMVPDQNTNARLIPFVFNADQTYDLLLGDSFMWVVQDAGLLLEAPIAITARPSADPLTLTISTASFSVGDNVVFEDVVGLNRTNGTNGIEERQLVVAAAAGDDYVFADVFGNNIDASAWTAFTSGNARRVYRVAVPWDATVLFELVYAQSADVITVTHKDYPEYKIQRYGTYDWRITRATYGSSLSAPTGLAVAAVNNPGTTEQFYYVYGVTAIDPNTNEESIPAEIALVNGALDQNQGVANQLAWDVVAGLNYRIYEAERAPYGSENSDGPWFLSFIGTAKSPPWNDNNIAPETSIVPPTNENPFQSGEFSSAVIITAGFGYLDPLIVVTDTKGSGAVLTATIDAAGALASPISVDAPGMDYNAPVLTVVDNNTTLGTGCALSWDGTWDTFAGGFIPADGSITISTPSTDYHVPYVTITPVGAAVFTVGFGYIETVAGVPTNLLILQQPFVTDTTGVTLTLDVLDTLPGSYIPSSLATLRPILSGSSNPAVNTYFLQRHVVAATIAEPAKFWMTRPGLYSNFDKSFPSQPNDALEGTIVSTEVNNIVSLTPMSFGLIALTRGGAYQISGGSPGAALTPTNITAQAQAFSGASALQPLRINANLVYETARGSSIRDLTYNFYVNIYTGEDISLLSEHLFRGQRLRQWAYAEEPEKLIHAVRQDGILLTCAYMKTEKVQGWTRNDTQGYFKSVSVTPQGDEDRVRYLVRRPLANGAFGMFIERRAQRFFGENYGLNIAPNPEAPWCVDCGVAYLPQNGPPGVTLSLVAVETLGQIGDPEIIAGGTGYPSSGTAQVLDQQVNGGSGATLFFEGSSGALYSATTPDRGSGYVAPYTVFMSEGEGAVVYLPVRNRAIFQTSSAYLTEDIVGNVLRVIGGRGTVVNVISSDQFEVEITQMFTGWTPNSEGDGYAMEPQEEGEWTLTPPVSVLGGLDYLEGKTVQIVADGAVLDQQVVTDGGITLAHPASYIIAGLGYTCQARTLRMDLSAPSNTIQGKRKSINAVTVRIADTPIVECGPSFDDLASVKPDIQGFGLPVALGNTTPGLTPADADSPSSPVPFYFTDHRVIIDGGWNTEGVVCIQQSLPRPATILAVIPEFNIGDQQG